MTVISLAQSNIVRSRSSLYKEDASQKKKARRILAIILVLSIIIALFFYILQANSTTAKGYKIRGLKKKIDTLEDTNRGLQVNISNLKSIGNLESRTENFDMVKAQSIEYVALPPASVVVAK